MRPKLVGPLLHPVSRSETWRRLVNLTNAFTLERFHFQARRSGPWRRAENWTSLAWRTCLDCARRTEKQEETDCKTTTWALYLIMGKSQRKKRSG